MAIAGLSNHSSCNNSHPSNKSMRSTLSPSSSFTNFTPSTMSQLSTTSSLIWRLAVVALLLAQIACTVPAVRATTDPLDCRPDQCAHISCPADSRYKQPRHHQQAPPSPHQPLDHHHSIDYDYGTDELDATTAGVSAETQGLSSSNRPLPPPPSAVHIANNQQRHHHMQRHHQQRHIADNDETRFNETDVDEDSSSQDSLRSRRSVRHFKPRITIVPVDHHTLHKRNIDAASAAAFNLTACCHLRHCECDTVCEDRQCAAGFTRTIHTATQLPGDCCDRVHCERPAPRACSSTDALAPLRQHAHGARWAPDECTQCECQDGRSQCQVTLCATLPCARRVRLAGECCERCDAEQSEFCAGEESCARRCRWGHVVDVTRGGCKLCKCAPKVAVTTSTVAPPTTSTTPALAVFEVSSSGTSSSEVPSIVWSSSSSVEPAPVEATTLAPRSTTESVVLEEEAAVSEPTDPTVLSIRSYFEAHHLYVIVSATVLAMAALFVALVWTYCKFSNKNSYNIVPNA